MQIWVIQVKGLEAEVDAGKKQIEQLKAGHASSVPTATSGDDLVAELQTTIQTLRRDLEDAKASEKTQRQQSAAASAELDRVRFQSASLTKANAKLKEAAAAGEASAKEAASLRAQADQLKQEKTSLQAQLAAPSIPSAEAGDASASLKVQELQDNLAAVQAENAALKREAQEAKSRPDDDR